MTDVDVNPKEQGQSLIELSLSLVMLLILLAGLVDLGRGFFTYITLRDAAQEGASYASVINIEDLEDTDVDGDGISDDLKTYCDSIENRALITTEDLSGGVSSGPINLKALAGADEVSVQTRINGAECTSVAPAKVCLNGSVSVRVEYSSFPLTMPFMGAIVGSQSIPLSAVVVDTILTPACQSE